MSRHGDGVRLAGYLSLVLSAAAFSGCSHDFVAPADTTQQPKAELRIIPDQLSLGVGESYQLETSGVPSFDVFWTSSDPDVASVSADGIVLAKSPGAATITAEAIGGRASATVYVSELSESRSNSDRRE